MLSLIDPASVINTLSGSDLDRDLRALLGDRYSTLRKDTQLYVVQGGDTPEVINAALGFPVTGDHAEEPSYSWIKDHGRWFEIVYLSRRTIIFVENGHSTELGIPYLCLSHFWPDSDGVGR